MSFFTTLVLATRALLRNWVRTLLTMIGIVFGISAVIAMVSAGQGAQNSVHEIFQSLGTNVLIVSNGAERTAGASGGAGSRMSLTWKDLALLQDGTIPTIRWVAPVLQTRGTQIASDEANWQTGVTGTTSVWFQIRSWKAAQGEVFDQDVGDSNAKVAVIGQTVASALFPGNNAVGGVIRIQGQPYEVIGVLEVKGQGPGGDNDDVVVIPVHTYEQKLEKGLAKYIKGSLFISMMDEDDAEQTIASVESVLREQHKLDSTRDNDFRIRNPADNAKASQDTTARISWLLRVVAAISLLIGGIGVMNIMLVSVIERTREIGIRMAVGAKPVDIMLQFLVEALVLALIGGVLGLGGGAAGAWGMAQIFHWKLFFPVATAGIAFGVAGGVGVLFGLYPAVRASQLDPITALRYES